MATIGVAGVASCGATAAAAGTYDVVACGDAPAGASSAWTVVNTAPSYLETGTICPPGGDAHAGLYAYDVIGGRNAPPGARAEWRFVAPAGTRIVRWRYRRYLGKDGSTTWNIYVRADSDVLETCSIPLGSPSCAVGAPGGENPGSLKLQSEINASTVALGFECLAPSGTTCAVGGMTIHNVWASLYASTVTLREDLPPSIDAASGPLLASDWQSGRRALTLDASDGVGIRETRVYVDGAVRSAATHACDFTRAIPCSNVAGVHHEVDSTALADGEHTLRTAAVDAAGNETRSDAVTLRVDNLPPEVSLTAPSGTTTSEQLYVTWHGSDAGAGIASYDVELSRDGGAFEPWLSGTTSTGAAFRAEHGHTYRWRVTAADLTEKRSEPATSDELAVHAPATNEPSGGAPPDAPPRTSDPASDSAGVSAPTRAAPALTIRSARRSGSRLVVSGTTAHGATGRVTASAAARVRGRLRSARAAGTVGAGRFRIVLQLPRALRHARRLTVRVRFPGDAAHLPASVRATVVGSVRPR